MTATVVLAAFLGTNKYKETTYSLYDMTVNTKFIQSALLQILNARIWKKEDHKILRLFLTPGAKKANWAELKSEIERLSTQTINLKMEVIDIEKDIVNSENDLWELFEKTASSFNTNETVFFDVTHGFRFYPMMLMTMLNFLKFTKNINVNGIYYGAWEAKKIKEDKEITPILELTDFDRLFDWIIGTQNFVKYGISETLSELLLKESNNFFEKSKDKRQTAQQLKKFAHNLRIFTASIRTCRGKEIISGFKQNQFSCESNSKITKPETIEYEILKNFPDKGLPGKGRFSRLLKDILQEVKDSLKGFSPGSTKNLFWASKWCLSKGLIQQGYTFLREYISTQVVEEKYGKKKIFCRKIREKAEKEFNSIGTNKNMLGEIGDIRNDINHCGMREKSLKAKQLSEKLEKLINKIKL